MCRQLANKVAPCSKFADCCEPCHVESSAYTCPQAKEALQSPYFDDLDKEAVDALESDVIRAREG